MLEVWEPEWIEEQKTNGRTLPLVMNCSRMIAEPGDAENKIAPRRRINRLMLVKAENANLTPRGVFCEVYGNLLAREFGITTPRPALVNITEEFVKAMRQTENTKHIALVPGIAAGCEFLKGLAPVALSVYRNHEEAADAQAIYGVDLLIQNPDRRAEKPNCALHSGGILAFDFELAFSFLVPLIGKQPEPWAVDEQGIKERHLFHPELKRRREELDWLPLREKLASLTEERLAAVFGSIAPAWRDYADKVTAHFGKVRMNADRFVGALIRSLQ